MTNTQIQHMVNRFLGWRLPEDFKPDGGISFTPTFNVGTPFQSWHQPSGTNLLNASQAEAMIRHLIEGVVGDKITLRPEVAWFAEQMELVLRANDHKPGWQNDAPVDLLKRLYEEVEELRDGMFIPVNANTIVKEAADVANFAMMIADQRRPFVAPD